MQLIKGLPKSLVLALCEQVYLDKNAKLKITEGVLKSIGLGGFLIQFAYIILSLPLIIILILKPGSKCIRIVTFYKKIPLIAGFIEGIVVLIRIEMVSLK